MAGRETLPSVLSAPNEDGGTIQREALKNGLKTWKILISRQIILMYMCVCVSVLGIKVKYKNYIGDKFLTGLQLRCQSCESGTLKDSRNDRLSWLLTKISL